jgi:hypothetical protein
MAQQMVIKQQSSIIPNSFLLNCEKTQFFFSPLRVNVFELHWLVTLRFVAPRQTLPLSKSEKPA